MAVYKTHLTEEQAKALIGKFDQPPRLGSLGDPKKVVVEYNEHRWEYVLPAKKPYQTSQMETQGIAPGGCMKTMEEKPMLKVKRYTETKKPLPTPPFLASDGVVTVLFVTLHDGVIVEPVQHPRYRILQKITAEYYKPFSGSLEMVV